MDSEAENTSNVEENDPQKKKKRFWIETLVSFLLLGVIFAVVFVIDYFPAALYVIYPLRCYGDSFAIPGILGYCFFLLLFVSRNGAFDMIIYGTKKFWIYLFRIHPERAKIAPTYYDYQQEKHRVKSPYPFGLLTAASVYFVIGLIFSFISLATEY
jgi:hypothetical protein